MKVYGEPLSVIVAILSLVLPILQPTVQQQPDFYAFWTSGRWYRNGVNPYLNLADGAGVGNLNAPALLPVFAILSALPFRVALAIWSAFNVAAYWLAGRKIAEAVAPDYRPLVICAMLLSYATFVSLVLGQLTALLTLLVTMAWIAERKHDEFRAGVWLGIAIALKPFIGLFALWAAARRSWRQLFGMLCGGAALGALGFAAGGLSLYRSWFLALRNVNWEWDIANASILGFLERVLNTHPISQLMSPLAVAPGWVQPLWMASIGLVLGLLFWRTRASLDFDWLAWICAALLLSPLGWMYYAPLGAGPAIAVYRAGGGATRACLIAGYICLLAPFPFVMQRHGPIGTFTIGSIYAWGLTAWFAAALSRPREAQPR
jgi:hypothetical protein